jgi:hypothetical protein
MTVLHPSDQKIEQYVRGRLGLPNSAQVVRLEEHLLVCPLCILRAEKEVALGQAIREALTTITACTRE